MDLINRSAGIKMKNDKSKWAKLVLNISKKVQRCLSTTLFMMKVMEMVMLGIKMAVSIFVFSILFVNLFKLIIGIYTQIGKGSKDVSKSFQQQDVLENIRFENDYTEHHLDDVQVEMEYEILSIYSCSECVMHEGSNNKEHRYISSL